MWLPRTNGSSFLLFVIEKDSETKDCDKAQATEDACKKIFSLKKIIYLFKEIYG
jgi:hypothetical protein